jgi:flagellar hook-basal body complex protein FliE
MLDRIDGIQSPQLATSASVASPAAAKSPESLFPELFKQAVARVEAFHNDSTEKTGRFLRGEEQEVHEMVLAAQRSQLSFELFLQVRNKVVQAYQEVMRMQV